MPLSTLPAAAEAAPAPAPAAGISAELGGLPPELISCILHRLDPFQIMLDADKVCRSWRRAARDEPELWRRIDMRGYQALSDRNLVDLNQMIDAVRRSQGQCQAFWGEGTSLHYGVLRCLADQ
ncbi:F-box protein SKIP19-like [Setaria italica]|uniref:F-box protein SKIP19-like n=1 Tax=Setaria italica TaxID=4555 RepID=UPI000350FC66|nr:F-box protein SKIP19-like [Setaria italica]XP_034580799.1 F-box protein SKIP19-like [Setaria viridis]